MQFGKRDIKAMYEATSILQGATDLPLLIGAEFLPFVEQTVVNHKQRIVAGNKPGQCDGQHDVLDSYLFKAAGLNHKLSPAVNKKVLSTYKNMEVIGTGLLPIDFSLGATPIVMTKHKNLADDDSIVTLSRQFIRNALYNVSLDKQFGGLLMIDSIDKAGLMRSDYAKFSPKWLNRHPKDDPKAVFAARALLAGHHMVYLNGVARDTLKVYQQLAVMACREDADGRRLQYAIAKSFHHISEFKKARRGALQYRPRMDEKLVKDVLNYKHRLQTNRCEVEDKFTFANLRERMMLAR